MDITSGISIKTEKGRSGELVSGRWFIASENPLYIGIILPPGPDLWADVSTSKSLEINFKDETGKFAVKQRVEVGENSIFFLKRSDLSSQEAKN